MTTLTLRKVGGSTMLALSPALLQILVDFFEINVEKISNFR